MKSNCDTQLFKDMCFPTGLWSTPIFLLRFCLVFICTGLEHVVLNTVSSCVVLSFCVQKILFPHSYPLLQAFTLFPALLQLRFLSLWRRGCSRYTFHLGLSILQSPSLCTFGCYGSLCYSMYIANRSFSDEGL